jgi:hypothetical protein
LLYLLYLYVSLSNLSLNTLVYLHMHRFNQYDRQMPARDPSIEQHHHAFATTGQPRFGLLQR